MHVFVVIFIDFIQFYLSDFLKAWIDNNVFGSHWKAVFHEPVVDYSLNVGDELACCLRTKL